MKEKIKFITSVFGKSKLQNNGIELMVPCPFCKETKKLKMNIRLDADLYHCWVCNSKGRNLARLIKQKKPSAVSEYFDKFGKNYKFEKSIETHELEQVELPDGFKLIMMNLKDPDAQAVRSYCHSRGFSDSDLWSYRVGYSDEWKWRRRMIIPSFDTDGNLNYFVTRAIDETPYKYLNAKANKRLIVFNDIDLDWTKDKILVVEGPLDLMKCGKINAVCILGSSLLPESVVFQKMVRNSMDVILALDPDAYDKQLRIAENLSMYDLNVYLASPKSGDIGDMDQASIEQLIKNAVEYNNDFGSLPFLINKI